MAAKTNRKETMSIGLYIGKTDHDLAVWCGMIKQYSALSFTNWISALLIAFSMRLMFDIGTIISGRANEMTTITELGSTRNVSYCGYGRATPLPPQKAEYPVGSVISIKITDPQIMSLLTPIIESGRPISPFIKSLIHYYLKEHPTAARCPSDDDCLRMLDQFALSCTPRPAAPAVSPSVHSTVPSVVPSAKSATAPTPVTNTAKAKSPNPLISFI